MNIVRAALAGVAVALAVAPATMPADAFVPVLSPALVRDAIAHGRAAAHARSGFPATGYVAFQTPDTLRVSPGQGAIDAVLIATPYERVAIAAYEAAFDNASPSPRDVSAAQTSDTLDVVVFAHARDPVDQSFLRRFKNPRLEIGGITEKPSVTAVEGPTKDFFTTPNGRALLWLGTLTLRFAVPRADDAMRATFAITDPYGRAYRIPLPLGRYR